jgi:hypothetical protein
MKLEGRVVKVTALWGKGELKNFDFEIFQAVPALPDK